MTTTKRREQQPRGSAGGKAVVATSCPAHRAGDAPGEYGRAHMQDLARRWHQKYRLVKYGLNDFLIVNRATGKPLSKTLNGHHYDPRGK